MKSKSTVPVALGIIVAAVFSVQGVRSQADNSNPRISGHAEGYTRFVLETPRAVKFTPQVSGRSLSLVIPSLKPSELRLGGTPRTVDTDELINWALEPKGTGSLLTLKSTFTLDKTRGYKVFTLPPDENAPHRLVVDLGPKITADAMAVATKPTTPSGSSKPSAPVARAPRRPDPIVVIDPGHGGIDSGMVGYVVEKQVTLDIGLKLRGLLMAKGIRVVMTRASDRAWQRSGSLSEKQRDLDARAQMASVERNLFVSIHVNSAGSNDARGVETFVFGEPLEERTLRQAERENGGGDIGRTLTRQLREASSNVINRQLIQENLRFSKTLAQAVQSNIIARTGAYSRGIDQAYFWVIRYSRIPAILVETGFGTNPTEGKNLATNAYRLQIAQGVADGILKFLRRE